jgi:hypothetical protein
MDCALLLIMHRLCYWGRVSSSNVPYSGFQADQYGALGIEDWFTCLGLEVRVFPTLFSSQTGLIVLLLL